MRKTVMVLTAISMLAFAGAVVAQDATPSQHVIALAAGLKWGDPPPVFEKGAGFTVIAGNPMEAGPYVVRLKMPAGYKIAPHWHPTDENVTVISGTFEIGMGDTFDKAALKALPAGGFALMPAQMRHYAMAKTAAIVQVHGMGPFQLTYVNPADDPSTKAAAGK
jgi:hypothetical protein